MPLLCIELNRHMKCSRELDEHFDHFTLSARKLEMPGNRSDQACLDFTILLKYFQIGGRFPLQLVSNFARELYIRLPIGVPIDNAVQEARTVFISAGDPTWLAYTVFADPLAGNGTRGHLLYTEIE